MSNQILISVVIPCYNDGSFLKEAIDSVKSHAVNSSYEIIIADDCSDDSTTLSILNSYTTDPQIKLLHSEQQKGPSAARNRAISNSVGKYILPLDADNRLTDLYFDKGVELLENNPDIDVVYADCCYFEKKTGYKKVGDLDIARLLVANYIDTCAIYRKSLWNSLEGYDELITLGVEDWDFWLRSILAGASHKYLSECGFEYRVHANSLTNLVGEQRDTDVAYIFQKPQLAIFSKLHNELSQAQSLASGEIVVDQNELHQRINALEGEVRALRNSFSYRTGNLIFHPLSILASLFTLGASLPNLSKKESLIK